LITIDDFKKEIFEWANEIGLPSHNKLFHALLSAYLAKKGMLKDSILV